MPMQEQVTVAHWMLEHADLYEDRPAGGVALDRRCTGLRRGLAV